MLETIHHGEIRELRLARPPANALDPTLIAALHAAVAAAPGAGVRALVLSGQPGWFSGGLDVPVLLQLDRAAMATTFRDFFALMRALAASPIPTVAAITGQSPAGGAVLSIFCDERVMTTGDVRIGLNEVQVGIPLPEVIYQALARIVGERQGERLAVGGLLVSPEEALRIGLVDELASPEAVVPRALERARFLITLPPNAMRITREVARHGLVAEFDRAAESTYERFLDDWFSAETQATLGALVARLRKK